MNYRACCIWFVVVSFSMTSHADILTEWFGEKAKEEVKNALPGKTKKMVDSLEFTGKQYHGILKDGTDHISSGFVLDPADDKSAAQVAIDDKKYYDKLRERTKEIALEHSPKIVKDAVSFFDTAREGGAKLLAYVGGVGASADDFDSQWAAAKARSDADDVKAEAEREKLRREWPDEKLQAWKSAKQASEKKQADQQAAEAKRLAQELGISLPGSTDLSEKNEHNNDAARLAKELGIGSPATAPKAYTASELQQDLAAWDTQERLRIQEEERQRGIREERERVAAIERLKREEVLRRQQQLDAQEARDRQMEENERQAAQREQKQARGPGLFDVLVQGANTARAIEAARSRRDSTQRESSPAASSQPTSGKDDSCYGCRVIAPEKNDTSINGH